MSEMVERVANVMMCTAGERSTLYSWHEMARAAITAMREPLEEACMTPHSCCCGHQARQQMLDLIDSAVEPVDDEEKAK